MTCPWFEPLSLEEVDKVSVPQRLGLQHGIEFLEGEEIRQSGRRNFLGFPKRWNGGVGGSGDKEMEEGCI